MKIKFDKTSTTVKMEFCECATPLDPYYLKHPLQPGVPINGPFCKRCGKFIKQSVESSKFTSIMK